MFFNLEYILGPFMHEQVKNVSDSFVLNLIWVKKTACISPKIFDFSFFHKLTRYNYQKQLQFFFIHQKGKKYIRKCIFSRF